MTYPDQLIPMATLMTAKEVAAALRVHTATLSKWRDKGIGPTYVMISPHSPRYVRAEIEALVRGLSAAA